MLNAEKYRSEILEAFRDFGFNKYDSKIVRCNSKLCADCLFSHENRKIDEPSCSVARMRWLLSEYKEHIKLSKLEYDILEYLSDNTEYLYIARESTSNIFVYRLKPTKGTHGWNGRGYTPLTAFKKLFLFIKWEDKEATSIKDVLENCVIEHIKEEQ